MTNEEVFNGIQNCMAEALLIEPSSITPASTQEEIEQWDSLGHLSIILAIEDAFGISFQMDDIPLMTSVELISSYIQKSSAS